MTAENKFFSTKKGLYWYREVKYKFCILKFMIFEKILPGQSFFACYIYKSRKKNYSKIIVRKKNLYKYLLVLCVFI